MEPQYFGTLGFVRNALATNSTPDSPTSRSARCVVHVADDGTEPSSSASLQKGLSQDNPMHNEMRSYAVDPLSIVGDLAGCRDRSAAEPRMRPPITWQVRRAEEYIESHWNQSITMARLARATAASARTIFCHFKRSRGQSPMSFLKQVRLEHAREMLEKSGVGRSVTEIAIDCGFGNLGHFAGDYLKRFGERPSDTLKRSKSSSLHNGRLSLAARSESWS
jgi:AraC-like DNA-binding protein